MWRLAVALILALVAKPATAADVEDATGRKTIPDKVERVMAAGAPASVVLYVLAPEKMIGWTAAPRPNEKPLLLPAVRDLPQLGRLTGRGDTANVEVVLKAKPDLILDFGTVNPTYISLAQRVQDQTGVPYLLFDGRLSSTARSIRQAGAALGVAGRAERIARYVEETDKLIDAGLKGMPPTERRRVYLARGADGLETGLSGSINTEIIERAGGVNVAERGAARAGLATVSLEQVLAWAPDTIVTGDANFLRSAITDPAWAAVPAAASKRVYLAPRLPFGWIDQPPSVNRTIGLRWMAGLLYPDRFPDDIRSAARVFIKLFYQTEPDDATLGRILAGEQPGGQER
ncbi:MAG: ABC transporter substrate-binding protein [Bradyrhizobiaceae bacterium]|nr:ABC transporter substrate-binding protein [Bradyrhizobiaceae bacterium]